MMKPGVCLEAIKRKTIKRNVNVDYNIFKIILLLNFSHDVLLLVYIITILEGYHYRNDASKLKMMLEVESWSLTLFQFNWAW
jgi:hypothetical protein